MNKKGGVESQVNWVYVMIIGGLLFLLFISIGYKIKNYSDQSYCSSVAKNIKSSIQISNYKENSISPSSIQLNDNIYYDGYSYFCKGISGSDVSNIIIFAASNLTNDGKKHNMVTITLPYYKPFFIANVIYYFNNDSVYYLDNSMYKIIITNYLLEKFKDDKTQTFIQSKFKSGTPSSTSGIKKNICVYNNSMPSDPKCNLKRKITAESEPLLILGQIISDSNDVFNINKEKLESKSKNNIAVINNKCNKIHTAYNNTNLICEMSYKNLCDEIKSLMNGFKFDYDISEIDNQNRRLAIQDCQYLY